MPIIVRRRAHPRYFPYRPFRPAVSFTLAFCQIQPFTAPNAGKLAGIIRCFRGYWGVLFLTVPCLVKTDDER